MTIKIDGDTVRLFLSQDDYCEFDISDIKDNQKRVDEELVKVIKARAKELVKFVDRVSFFKGGTISLFGSRVDDNKKGGDIDLYIQPNTPLDAKERLDKNSSIEKEALRTGIIL